MDKQNRNILAGIVVIVVILVAFNMSQDDIQTNAIIVVETPENVGVVGSTAIVCPEDYTVISTLGGSPDQEPMPRCKAPNPSVEVFDCGDSVVDNMGNLNTIQCTSAP
jgi:hypothetical protein